MFFDSSEPPEIQLGNMVFTYGRDRHHTTELIPLWVYGNAPFSFTIEKAGLMLNIDARDSKGAPVLTISKGEIMLSPESWDATLVGANLRIWERPGDLLLSLIFKPPKRIVVERYRMNILGGVIDVRPTEVSFLGGTLPNVIMQATGAYVTCFANIGILFGEVPARFGGESWRRKGTPLLDMSDRSLVTTSVYRPTSTCHSL